MTDAPSTDAPLTPRQEEVLQAVVERHIASDSTEQPLQIDVATAPETEPTAAATNALDATSAKKDVVVAVGSKNPVKVEATRRAFQSVFRDANVVVVSWLSNFVMLEKMLRTAKDAWKVAAKLFLPWIRWA
ncbi:MAG: hypothetical protein ACPGN4_08160 [Miltoncostaeaceae bacterium]